MSTTAQRLQRLDPRLRLRTGALRVPAAKVRARDLADLALALGLLAVAAAMTAGGSGPLRTVVGSIAVFCLPGYLLLEAIAPSHLASPSRRAVRPLLALGLSPAVVGIAAMAAALFKAFNAPGIVLAVLLVSLALAAVAALRRVWGPRWESLPDAWWSTLQLALQRRA
jgi:uncharacterized membrane protein